LYDLNANKTVKTHFELLKIVVLLLLETSPSRHGRCFAYTRKVRMPGAYYTPGETPIAANSESATTPPATQVSSVSVLSTLQKPPEGGNPTTTDLAVVAQLLQTTTQVERNRLAAIHNDQQDVSVLAQMSSFRKECSSSFMGSEEARTYVKANYSTQVISQDFIRDRGIKRSEQAEE
jgi:hypothetical protein